MIDSLVIGVPSWVVILLAAAFHLAAALLAVVWLLDVVGLWLYFAMMESSTKQATLGKMAIGIIVTDLNGNRITFGRATGRYFGKLVSSFTFGVGYLMAGFTQRKQALHDIMAGSLVVIK